MDSPALVFMGSTLDEAEAAKDAYFAAHPDELARFADNPSLNVELLADRAEGAAHVVALERAGDALMP